MKVLIDKNLATLIHVYDILNGGYYAAHHQLRFFDDRAYTLYLNDDREGLRNLYYKLKNNVPDWILKFVENSKGIRYFCCDGCHDAKVVGVECFGDELIIKLDTSGMLGCLNVDKFCTIKIKTSDTKPCDDFISDFEYFEQMYWLSTDITFEEGKVNFELGVQVFSGNHHEDLCYKFKILDIEIE